MKNRLQKPFFIGNCLLFICAVICLVFYDLYGGLRLKGVTSSWFVMLGWLNLIYARKMKLKMSRFLLFMELGLFFDMCADILLGVQFLVGVLFFAAGHVFYLIAFYSLEKFRWRDVFLILPIAAVSIFAAIGTPYIQIRDSFTENLLIGYAVIISCMLGKAISNVSAERNIFRIMILIGSVMFWFSDLMLAIDMFGEDSRLTWALCSYTYWPAQNILAFSLYYYINEQRKPDGGRSTD